MKRKIADSELRRLHSKGNLRPTIDLVFIALRLAAAFWLAAHFHSWWSYLLAIVLIGTLQHHLSIVHHEAVHSLFFSSRLANEIILRIVGWAIGFGTAYREQHFAHHRRLGTDQDPDIHNYLPYPLPMNDFLRDLLKNASGFAAVVQFVRQSSRFASPAHSKSGRGLVDVVGICGTQLGIAAAFVAIDRWFDYLLLWIVPLVVVAKLLAHLRNVAEHTRTLDAAQDDELSRLRTFRCGRIEAFFFAPLHFNYHAEHHLFPSVPYYRLPQLHRVLVANPSYGELVDLAGSYTGFLLRRAIRIESGMAA